MQMPLEVLAEELGQFALSIRREIRDARDVTAAEIRAELAALRQSNAEMRLEIVALQQETRERVTSLRDGRDGEPGPAGEHGAAGSPGRDGKLPLIREWAERVHYESDVVAHDGAAFQALRDTGRTPPHEDWICIARKGRDGVDGRTFSIRGTWNAEEEYRELDVVMLNGASFAARWNAPGVCPGEGWQLMAEQGRRGKPGEPGRRGEQGPPGPPIVAADIDREGLLTLTNGDGSAVTCDFYPLLARFGK